MITPDGGINETEPTLIGDNQVQNCTGAEYRVGERGLYVAKGRALMGTVSGVSWLGGYDAGFDQGQYLIGHAGDTYYYAAVAGVTVAFTAFDSLPSGSSAIVGSHYNNRHYVANGVANRRIEYTASGLTAYPIGMSRSTLTVGVSLTQGAGSMSATTGLVYWVTEYDSARGIESMTGSSISTGAFTSLDGAVVTVTGTSINPLSDQLRWYRSVDGGGFPDGGLIATTAIGTTSVTDTLAETGTLTVPLYGIVSIGGVDYERDEPPPVFSAIFGPFKDSLIGIPVSDPRTPRFTPAGYPDSWPSGYAIPLETPRQDRVINGAVMSGRIAIVTKDSAHVLYRLPRDSDSVFAAGEMSDIVTLARGGISRRGICMITPPGGDPLILCVARDGIWASPFTASPVMVTDQMDWAGRVSIADLPQAVLRDDPLHRRAVFMFRRASDTGYNTGVWFLDYQDITNQGIRITVADHGPLVDGFDFAASDGARRFCSFDSRPANGQMYVEGDQDADDSQLIDSSGTVVFRARLKEYMPAGPRGTVTIGKISIMHDAGPPKILTRMYFDRRDLNPETKPLPDSTSRQASDVSSQRSVNSVSLEIESAGTTSYGIHWIDLETFDPAQAGGRKGA